MNQDNEGNYSGIDVLNVMTEAKNYNKFLISLILRGRIGTDAFVDFGAGSGTFAKMLRQQNYKVICVECDNILAQNLLNSGFDVFSSIDQIDEVKYLYSLNVLEHIEDDARAVKDIFRQLRSGGEVFFYVPAFMLLYSSMDRKVGHFRRYRKGQLVTLFEFAGFNVDDAKYADSLGFLVTLVFKMFGNKDGDINPKALKIYDKLIFPISRIFDTFLSPFFGKNVMIRAHKPE